MTKLYHQTPRDGHGGIPAWWFGAPFFAFVYAFATPGVLPDLVSLPATLPPALAVTVRWFIGLVLAVALLASWQLVRWVRSMSRPRPLAPR